MPHPCSLNKPSPVLLRPLVCQQGLGHEVKLPGHVCPSDQRDVKIAGPESQLSNRAVQDIVKAAEANTDGVSGEQAARVYVLTIGESKLPACDSATAVAQRRSCSRLQACQGPERDGRVQLPANSDGQATQNSSETQCKGTSGPGKRPSAILRAQRYATPS